VRPVLEGLAQNLEGERPRRGNAHANCGTGRPRR
jgi:hypothetical protein